MLLFALGGAPLWAAPAERARPDKRRAAPKVKAVVLVQRADGVKPKTASRVQTRLRRALKKNDRLDMVRPSRKLASFAGEVPTGAIREARDKLRVGFAHLESGRYKEAITAFSAARRAQLKALPYIKKSHIAMVQFGKALAYFHKRLYAATLRTLAALFTWRPRLKIRKEILPKRFLRLIKRARRISKKRGRGTLVIRTRPAKAKVYINGHSVGYTPLLLEGVPVGTHYLSLRKRGFFKLSEVVEVPKKNEKAEYEYALQKNEKFLLLDQALERSWPKFGEKRATASMTEIQTLLGVDQLILVKPSPPTDQGIRVEACLYDLRTGHLLKRMSGTLPGKRFKARKFAKALYTGVSYEGTIPDPGEEKVDTGPPPKPFWKRWWFWTAIGAAVAATVTGIAVPLATRDQGPSVPSGYHGVSVRF
jgi:hypothetical protein